MLKNKINELKNKIEGIEGFSGVVLLKEKGNVIFNEAYGYANIAEETENKLNTSFGIASGAKILAAIAICQLVDKKVISFDSLLKDCVDVTFENFDDNITIEHLLTHTSGVSDYFDEETMTDFSDLWINNPMYMIREPKDFLSMFQNKKMKSKPSEKFSYNNAGFIILGLVVEKKLGMSFTEYVKQNIFQPLEMNDSGYFSMDMLPKNCAYGYVGNNDGTMKTNIYSVPIIGGPDGGVFITTEDMDKLWRGLLSYKILSEKVTKALLTPHVYVNNDVYYGYGIWIIKKEDIIMKYYLTGSDPGVSFQSAFYPKQEVEVTVLANKEFGAYQISRAVEELM